MLKKIAIFSLLILCIGGLSAQTGKPDSLKNVLAQAKQDTTKINALNEAGKLFLNTHPDTSLLLFDRSRSLAEKLNDEVRKAEAIRWFGQATFNLGKYDEALKLYSEAIAITEKEIPRLKDQKLVKAKIVKASSLNATGTVYFMKGDFSEAFNYYSAALMIDREAGNKKGEATDLGNIGIAYMNQSNHAKALEYYFKALRIDEELKNRQGVARHLGNIGGIYQYQANYNEALKYYLQALKMNEELDNKKNQSANLVNIGLAYKLKAATIVNQCKCTNDSGNYAKALEYYHKGLRLAESINDKKTLSAYLGNIGSVYMDIGESLRGTCKCNQDSGNLKKALEYYFSSVKIAEEIGDKRTLTINTGNMGLLYLHLNDLANAEKFINRSFGLAKETGSKDDIMQAHSNLSSLYEKMGKTDQSFKHYKLFVLYRDSINSLESVRKQTQAEMQYGFSKKQQADSIRNAEATAREVLKHEQEIKQQRVYTFGGILGFVLMLVIAVISFRAYRQKQKANEIISEQKLLVEEKQKEVMDSIRYAKRIQQSLLPTEKYIGKKIEGMKNKD